MIKLLRVDERLIHGQVAFAWTNSLKADCILIVNDAVAADKLRSNSLKMAAPAGVKFREVCCKNIERCDSVVEWNKDG